MNRSHFPMCVFVVGALCAAMACSADAGEGNMPWSERVQVALDNTEPLQHPREGRLPLYLWPAINPGKLSDEDAERLVRLLDERGVGLVCSWRPGDVEACLEECLPVARAQKKLGLRINVNATSVMYSFFDGSGETAHLDNQGQPFFDDTFGKKDMGCPFRLAHRIEPMRQRILDYAVPYAEEGLEIGFIFSDWEVDGPLEWNRAWEASKKCTVCREQVPEIGNFLAYQQKLRELRSMLQRVTYAEPILERFPDALVGNYAVYPHDGYRYWYDYFERYADYQPAITEQRAKYRHWANDFETSGYTFAMPVLYPWSWCWNWYDFESADYRWVYNALLVGSNAGRYTPAGTPLIPFVHWHTVDVGPWCEYGDPPIDPTEPKQLSKAMYQEQLWHAFLRGADTMFLWCTAEQFAEETRLLHEVYAAVQEYGRFLDDGTPVNFDLPNEPGPVVSGLRLGNEVLVRRTDFTDTQEPVALQIGEQTLQVPRKDGVCQILTLD